MAEYAYDVLVARAMDDAACERSIQYLTEHLSQFLKKRERVLICFQEHEKGNLSWLMEQAVLRSGACPIVWGLEDHRWKSMLRLAFSYKVSVVIGEPLLVLGLRKLMKACKIPLYVRRVITAGYPCLPWMIRGLVEGLDCVAGGCLSLGISGVVAGFACGHSWGVHLREAEYGVDIVDDFGNPIPDGEVGNIVLYPRDAPEFRHFTGDRARLVREPCGCGSATSRLMDMVPGLRLDPDMLELGQRLQSWSSILDCAIRRGPCGLEIELVTFAGEKLPKLPTAARLTIRHYDPERDEPMRYMPALEKVDFSPERY